jgi:hypothetical protein
MKTHLIINNFFTNPKEIVKFALKQKFYTKDNHPHKKTLGAFPGNRTDYINNINKKAYKSLLFNLEKALHIFLEKDNIKYTSFVSFQYTTEETNKIMPAWHTDAQEDDKYSHKVSGVVYLNEDADPSSGTTIVVNDNAFMCSNEFNKLFMYRSDLMHTAAKSFGSNKLDGRMTIAFLFLVK